MKSLADELLEPVEEFTIDGKNPNEFFDKIENKEDLLKSCKDDESKETTPVKKEIIVGIDKEGTLDFTNQLELGSAARFVITMKLAPESLRTQKDSKGNYVDNIPAVMAALTLCRQRRLPFSAMNEMGFVKGKLTCYGSLTTAFCEKHPEYGEQKIYSINEKQEIICLNNKNLKDIPWACVIQSRKKNSEIWNEYVFSVDDAETAGLLTKNTKPDSGWIKYVKDLLYNKAKNRMQRADYASALVGINDHEDFAYEQNAEAIGKKSLSEKINELKDVSNAEEK